MSKTPFYFPKGYGIKIIKQESEAVTHSSGGSIYIRAINDVFAEMIIVSKTGKKRKIGFDIPENIALTDAYDFDGNLTESGNVYLKEQVNLLLSEISSTISENLDPRVSTLEQNDLRQNSRLYSIENKNTQQDNRLSAVELKNTEQQSAISTIQSILSSDDVTLDQLQEIVNYIKENRSEIDALGIDSIIGLRDYLQEFSTHIENNNNPHGVTKEQVGLSNVDNTSDADKPISNAQKAALDLKIDKNTDDSLIIEGNVINSNTSMMSEDFIYSSSSSFQLGFEPSTIVGVFVNGILLNYTEYSFDMNKIITVSKPLVADDFITIKYHHLLNQ